MGYEKGVLRTDDTSRGPKIPILTVTGIGLLYQDFDRNEVRYTKFSPDSDVSIL